MRKTQGGRCGRDVRSENKSGGNCFSGRNLIVFSALLVVLTALAGLAGCGTYRGEGAADKADQPVVWWTDYPRFHALGMSTAAADASADVYRAGSDEGRAAYNRTVSLLTQWQAQFDLARSLGLKTSVWVEGNGEARTFIGAIRRDEQGRYVTDNKTGLPAMAAHYWTWDTAGPSVNPNVEIVWFGVHSWANREPWYGDTAMPANFPVPKYPDGSSALGWLPGREGSKDPRDYRLYDALACKSILGYPVEQEQYAAPVGKDTTGMLQDTMLNGKTRYIGDYYFARDPAANWWIDCSREAVEAFIRAGTDAFWVDNYTGWGSIGNTPVQKSFGDWSVAGFRDYLKEHPVEGIRAENFDVRQYLLAMYTDLTGKKFENITNATMATWNRKEFLDDPVWRHYLAYLSETQEKTMAKYYAMIKDAAAALGRNPDDIAVTVNGVVSANNATFTTDQYADVFHAEYGAHFSAVTRTYTNGIPPYGNAGGHHRAAGQFTRSRRPVVWYYFSGTEYDKYKENPNAGALVSFEALANNTALYLGNVQCAGNAESDKRVNRFIGAMRPVFSQRDLRSSVGVYLSPMSEYSRLTPGGYADNGMVLSTLGYYGWTDMLDKLHIPNIPVLEFKCGDKLEEIDVLIMSNINAIYESTIQEHLIPFLDAGRTLLITGAQAGASDGRDHQFRKHDEPLLVRLAREYKGPGKIIYMENDELVPYFTQSHLKSPDASADLRDKLLDLFESLEKEDRYAPDLLTEGFGPNYVATVNRDGEAGRLFVDIANKDIDMAADAVRPMQEGTVRVKLPEWLKKYQRKLKATVYGAGEDPEQDAKPVPLSVKVEDGYAVVRAPAFSFYACIVIESE